MQTMLFFAVIFFGILGASWFINIAYDAITAYLSRRLNGKKQRRNSRSERDG